MGKLEIYLDPFLEEPYFSNIVHKGYRIVRDGTMIPIEDIIQLPEGTPGISKSSKVRAVSREGEFGIRLLCPVGGILETSGGNALRFFAKDDNKPLFQKFADLKTEQDILDFAAEYGQLKDYTLFAWDQEGSKVIPLDSISCWEAEIVYMRELLNLIADYEGKKPLEKYLRHIGEGEMRFVFPIEKPRYHTRFEPKPSDSYIDIVFELISRLIDSELRHCPLMVSHQVAKGAVSSSNLRPLCLKGAIWLQLSQSFFKDAPKNFISRRCFLTGEYFRQSDMKLRKVGPNKDKWYHPRNKHIFYQQQRNKGKAAKEGRTIKEERKGKTKFFVSEF